MGSKSGLRLTKHDSDLRIGEEGEREREERERENAREMD